MKALERVFNTDGFKKAHPEIRDYYINGRYTVNGLDSLDHVPGTFYSTFYTFYKLAVSPKY